VAAGEALEAAPVEAVAADAAAAAAPASAPAAPAAANGAVKASPVARRMARQLSVEIGAVAGTGTRGRITKADVEAAAGGGASARPAAPALAPAPEGGRGAVERIELTRVQAVVARRMVQSKAEAPEFLLTIDVDMTDAVRLRGELKALADDARPVPSLNDFVVRAAALALARHPEANAAFVDGAIERYARINVGIAVAGDGTLLVPTVFDADRKALGVIAADTRRLALAARDGAVTPADLGGGTFTVSNLGMFGIQHFTAVINPPQAAILAVGQLETRPVWDGATFVPRSLMTMTLSCDHRVLYGAEGAGFLASIRDGLQQPLRLAL
jgi:pyruvate dehydrogenase E2 component (dihydrolipoamide acetyltransferase)